MFMTILPLALALAAAPPPPAIRGTRGDIELTTTGGAPVKLSQYGARVTVIAVWATWCEPCLEELPLVQALADRFAGDRNVAVLAVNLDDVKPDAADVVAETARKHHLRVPVLVDSKRAFRNALTAGAERSLLGTDSFSLPTLLTIDDAFRIRREEGYDALGKGTFVERHAKLIEEAKAGKLTENEQPSGKMKPGKLKMPPISKGEFEEMWPSFAKQYKRMYSIDDAQLARAHKAAQAQAGTGQPIEVDLAAPAN
jgi:thiol-disulfide isomerase/thioredoxin